MARLPKHVLDQQIELFAASYLLEGKYNKAYKASHPETKIKHNYGASNCGKAFYHKHQERIDARIAEIKDKTSKECNNALIIERETGKKILSQVAKGEFPGCKVADILKAVELMSRMEGWNAPDRVQSEHVLSLAQLTTDFGGVAALPAPAAAAIDAVEIPPAVDLPAAVAPIVVEDIAPEAPIVVDISAPPAASVPGDSEFNPSES